MAPSGSEDAILSSFIWSENRRAGQRTVGSTTTQFLYDGLNPVQELASGTPTANLLTGLGIDEYFTRTDAAGDRNLLADALGSTIALADGSGSVQTEYTYEPFGSVTTSGASSLNTFGFTGRENDATGLNFYRTRYYDPGLQRFISTDPIGFSAGDWNLFAYALSSPTNFSDPFGLSVKNNSSSTVWVKRETDCKTVAVPPGGEYPGAQDGIALPAISPNRVYKNVDGVDVEVTAAGRISISSWTQSAKQRAAEFLGRAGWKGFDWQSALHSQSPSDYGWDNLFERSNPKNPAGRKDSACK